MVNVVADSLVDLSTPRPTGESASLIAALAYADLFDYPLSREEITRFQVGTRLSYREVTRVLDDLLSAGIITEHEGRFCLSGREAVFGVRQDRERESARVWQRAKLYAPIIAGLPFVRMVAVTGALAVNNLNGRPDIDLLVLVKPGRVWICRRFLVALVRVARLFGDDLCPNYVLSTKRLQLDQRDFFTAHELAQMVPLYGAELYRAMLKANEWAARYLPSAFGPGQSVGARRHLAPVVRLPKAVRLAVSIMERVLSLSLFDKWERWEMLRLRRKLRAEVGHAAEVVCAPDQCKGHTGLHRRSILDRLSTRLSELGLSGHISGI